MIEVLYLVFNDGYSATTGEDWVRPALCADALRLGRILAELVPEEPEGHGLVALMEIQASRLKARVGPAGGLELVDALSAEPRLEDYHLLPGVRGDLLASSVAWTRLVMSSSVRPRSRRTGGSANFCSIVLRCVRAARCGAQHNPAARTGISNGQSQSRPVL